MARTTGTSRRGESHQEPYYKRIDPETFAIENDRGDTFEVQAFDDRAVDGRLHLQFRAVSERRTRVATFHGDPDQLSELISDLTDYYDSL